MPELAPRRAVRLFGALLLALALTFVAGPVEAVAAAKPTSVKVISASNKALAVSWSPVAGAARYSVQYSTSASMKKPKYAKTTKTYVELGGLSAGKTYYLRVRVLNAKGKAISAYSAKIKKKTKPKTGYPYLAPKDLRAGTPGDDQISLTWASRSSAAQYQIAYRPSSSSSYRSIVVATPKASLTGLNAATTYYVKVRVLNAAGVAKSDYSPEAKATTTASTHSSTTSTSASLRVASFNVGSAFASGPTWASRATAVVSTIKGQNPDVVGLQEASQGRLDPSVSYAQFDDLIDRLGDPYKLTNNQRYNCVNSITPDGCVEQDRGASGGTRIAYNSTVLSLEAQGSKLLSKTDATSDRFAAWAIFQHRASGKRFFFVDVHLDAGSGNYDLRIVQTKDLLALIAAKNPDKLPTYVVGDFNSGKWAEPSNAPYDLMVAAGYLDPLGNTYRSTQKTAAGIAGKRIRANCDSFNGYEAQPKCVDYAAANYLDYIWVSKGVKVPEWETVIKADSAGRFLKPIPSDHNMLRATTTLP